jgi:hypothetical protein
MKKTNVFMGVIVIAMIFGALYVTAGNIGDRLNIWNPALKLTITTGVNESDGSPTITNITFEQTRVIYKGTDAKVNYPDISVMARNESVAAAPVSYWAAEPWVEGNNKTITLTLSFRETYLPKNGDLLILTIRFTGIRGYILGKNTAFYEWQ